MARYAVRKTNKETSGVVHYEYDDEEGNARIKGAKDPFVMLYQEASKSMASDHDVLKNVDFRVLRYLEGIMDTENWIDIHHGRLARQIGISRSQVTKALGRLVEAKILLKGSERTYRMNPGVGWKGDRRTQAEAQKEIIRGNLSLVRS